MKLLAMVGRSEDMVDLNLSENIMFHSDSKNEKKFTKSTHMVGRSEDMVDLNLSEIKLKTKRFTESVSNSKVE